MSDAVTAKILELARKARGSVDIGFIDNDQAQIAYWNEYGHKGRFPAPPRPFFRNMVSEKSSEWPAMMASELKRTNMDGHKTLAYMGKHVDGELKDSIANFSGVPLSPVTLLLRYEYGNNPQDIRARDVLAAQQLIKESGGVGILLPGNRGSRSKKSLPMVTYTQAAPLRWTGEMLDSTSYKVKD